MEWNMKGDSFLFCDRAKQRKKKCDKVARMEFIVHFIHFCQKLRSKAMRFFVEPGTAGLPFLPFLFPLSSLQTYSRNARHSYIILSTYS